MIRRRRIEIVASSEQRIVLRHTAAAGVLVGCTECGTRMVTPEEAAIIARTNTRTIYRWVETGAVHFSEHNGRLWICYSSLPADPHA